MYLTEFVLIENLLWEIAERRLSRKYIQQYKPFPLPSEDARLFNTSDITVESILHPNKRDQLVTGVRESSGRIIAFADDDVLWSPHTLLHLLAPFQEPDIGLVGGPIESYLPENRQDASVITPYEVAALRNRSKRRGGNKAFYARDGSTNFTVSGATMLLRAAVVRDPDFQNAFMQETFAGIRQNSGDDAFITRWVLFQHLREGRKCLQKWRLVASLTK